MDRNNCTGTILPSSVSAALSLTWRGWFLDGKRLIVAEALRVASLGKVWAGRARSRRQLKVLDARLLADIGKTPQERRDEVEKPFWKV